MTLTQERPTPEDDVRLRPDPAPVRTQIPEPNPPLPRPPLPERVADYLSTPISGMRAAGLAVAWFTLFWIGVAAEPLPADPEAVGGLISEVLLPLGFVAAMGTMFVGLAHQRRWGVVGAVVASGMLVAASVLCPATGHHTFGTWWFVQMGAATTALGLSWRLLRTD